VIWSTGYGCDFGWIDLPVLDGRGANRSTATGIADVPGLYFLGLAVALEDEFLVPGGCREGRGPARGPYCREIVAHGRASSKPARVNGTIRTIALTSVAMLCFAANSLLCRLALAPKLIDPATFTSVRVLSAAALLTVCVLVGRGHLPRRAYANVRSIAALSATWPSSHSAIRTSARGRGLSSSSAGCSSRCSTVAWREGERFSLLSWLGLGLALLGVIYLVLPGVSAPDPLGAALMAISGASFGLFSLLARRGNDPVEVNASNLLWCLPPLALVNLCLLGDFTGTPAGFGWRSRPAPWRRASATSSGIWRCAISRRDRRRRFSFRCRRSPPWAAWSSWPSRYPCGC
jgi:hypothetical protein